jgi:hypothetical protein
LRSYLRIRKPRCLITLKLTLERCLLLSVDGHPALSELLSTWLETVSGAFSSLSFIAGLAADQKRGSGN